MGDSLITLTSVDFKTIGVCHGEQRTILRSDFAGDRGFYAPTNSRGAEAKKGLVGKRARTLCLRYRVPNSSVSTYHLPSHGSAGKSWLNPIQEAGAMALVSPQRGSHSGVHASAEGNALTHRCSAGKLGFGFLASASYA